MTTHHQYCLTHQTQMQPLTHICLLPSCQSQLLCALCLIEQHKDHPFMTVQKMVSAAGEMGKDAEYMGRRKRVNKKISEYIEQVKKLREDINGKLAEVEEKVNNYYGEVDKRLKEIESKEDAIDLGMPTGKLSEFSQSEILSMRLSFMKKKNLRDELSAELSAIQNQVTNYNIKTTQILSMITPKINILIGSAFAVFLAQNSDFPINIIETSQKQTEKQKTLPNLIVQESNQTLRWSPTLKHNRIQVNGFCAKRIKLHRKKSLQKDQCSPPPACCLGDSVFSDNSRVEPYSWAIKILKMKQKIIIGMCQVQKAQQNNFENTYFEQIGHSHYCVDQVGGVYSHSDPKINFQAECFELKAGDVITFLYDRAKEKLKLTNDYGENYQMDVLLSEGNIYAVCAYLFNLGDSIELVKP